MPCQHTSSAGGPGMARQPLSHVVPCRPDEPGELPNTNLSEVQRSEINNGSNIFTSNHPYGHKSIYTQINPSPSTEPDPCRRWSIWVLHEVAVTTHLVNPGSRWERTEESSADHLVWVWPLLLHKQWMGGEGRGRERRWSWSGEPEKGGEGSGAGLEGENRRREGRAAALVLLRWRGEESMGGVVVVGRAGVERDTAGKESVGMWLHRRRVRWVARVWGAIYMWGGDGDGLGWPVNGAAY